MGRGTGPRAPVNKWLSSKPCGSGKHILDGRVPVMVLPTFMSTAGKNPSTRHSGFVCLFVFFFHF